MNNAKNLNRIIFFLSLLGVIMAVYVLQSFLRQSPIVCLTTGCDLVRKSTASYPLGIPVPAFGLVGYTLITIFAFLRTTSQNKNLLKAILGVATFGILFVSWFTYTEVFVIKGVCTWCAISTVNMWIIFGLTIKSLLTKK